MPSLQSYSGLLNMPNARVIPDWNFKIHYGNADPYQYSGAALGLWDKAEIYGQIIRINTFDSWDKENRGDNNDFNFGGRLILAKEDDYLPQVAIGAHDISGKGFFDSRYLVFSKKIRGFDLTLGAGQGAMAGEFVSGNSHNVTTSKLFRDTDIFAGIEWQIIPDFALTLEYSSLDWENLFGYVDQNEVQIKEDKGSLPFNCGLKYTFFDHLQLQAGYLQGNTWSGSLSLTFPLVPQGLFSWKKNGPYNSSEKLRWQAYHSSNNEISRIIANEIKLQGFNSVSVSCKTSSIWVEAENILYMSDSRALGHLFDIVDRTAPERIKTVYLNLIHKNQVLQSLKSSRSILRAFMQSIQDRKGLLHFADLDLYKTDNWVEYQKNDKAGDLVKEKNHLFSYHFIPEFKTIIDDSQQEIKNKAVIRAKAEYSAWSKRKIICEIELPLLNQFDDFDLTSLEDDQSLNINQMEYEEKNEPGLSVLCLNQFAELPNNFNGLLTIGYLEPEFAGLSCETFRYYNDGKFGMGLQGDFVQKRDKDNPVSLNDDNTWYYTAFVNLYAQILLDKGVEAGLKLGRFLAGDPGARFELRRSYNYFTIGAFFTATDTSCFKSNQNRNDHDMGVYFTIPLSIIKTSDSKGRLRYSVIDMIYDTGQTINRPISLYPLDPFASPAHTRNNIDDMRLY